MNKLIFVSCGQETKEEKLLAGEACKIIDSVPGFKSYYAQKVQSLQGLSHHIFEALKKCSGMVVILHQRGNVLLPNKQIWGVRSSVWINQEVALAAFRSFAENVEVQILCFKDKEVKLEGAMTALITNPHDTLEPAEIVRLVREWLQSAKFELRGHSIKVAYKLIEPGNGNQHIYSFIFELTNETSKAYGNVSLRVLFPTIALESPHVGYPHLTSREVAGKYTELVFTFSSLPSTGITRFKPHLLPKGVLKIFGHTDATTNLRYLVNYSIYDRRDTLEVKWDLYIDGAHAESGGRLFKSLIDF